MTFGHMNYQNVSRFSTDFNCFYFCRFCFRHISFINFKVAKVVVLVVNLDFRFIINQNIHFKTVLVCWHKKKDEEREKKTSFKYEWDNKSQSIL